MRATFSAHIIVLDLFASKLLRLLTFKSRRFKYPVLSEDRNFLWGFKHLLQWLGKFLNILKNINAGSVK
jgi:hypothetical protein